MDVTLMTTGTIESLFEVVQANKHRITFRIGDGRPGTPYEGNNTYYNTSLMAYNGEDITITTEKFGRLFYPGEFTTIYNGAVIFLQGDRYFQANDLVTIEINIKITDQPLTGNDFTTPKDAVMDNAALQYLGGSRVNMGTYPTNREGGIGYMQIGDDFQIA